MIQEEKYIQLEKRIKRLNNISLSLSSEDDINVIFELILEEAKYITNADGRTLYMKNRDGKSMVFEILQNDSMNMIAGGTSGKKVKFPNISLYDESGKPNMNNVNTYVVHTGQTLNIVDAYEEEGFDFSGTIFMDKKMGYHSQSFLNVPLKNHENDTIGVMQLINSKNTKTWETQPFTDEMQELVESLASQAAVALTNKNLVKELKNLFESFIKLIATAIDKKSPYTGGHCERVPEIAMSLANAAANTSIGKFKDFTMSQDELYELYIASWLHDCGKVATPIHIVDKATKLETITDRIETINTRFEVLKRDLEISMLKKELHLIKNDNAKEELKQIKLEYDKKINKLLDEKIFIRKINFGSEFMHFEDQDRVRKIAKYKWIFDGVEMPLLNENDVCNLQISKGTLTSEERLIINEHINITIDMLEQLPYPKNLKNVPEYAGGHHEKINGEGYPKGLTGDEMSIQAKIMAISDIFEALTAKDRPYKKGKKLSEAMKILLDMKNNNEIDKDLFEIFIRKGVYKKYAEKYLDQDQIDAVDENILLS